MAQVEKMREAFAERVARSLGEGVVPWQRRELSTTPVQGAVSGRSYGGANALYLMEKCAEAGYKDPRFITASEANKLDLWVKKGEHGVPLEHWSRKEDGKPEVRMYSAFNVEQLHGDLSKLPTQGAVATDLEKAREMLKNAGIEMSPECDVDDYRETIKALVSKFAEESGYKRSVHTPELMALRANIASTFVMREAGIVVHQPDDLPTKSWAASIRHDPSQLYKAIRDGSNIAKGVISSMTQEREANQFRAAQERMEAQKAQEIVTEALTVPRGADFNLPNADLSGTQEAVVAATEKAASQVNELRASAAWHEASASPNKLMEARELAQKQMGGGAILTSAQPGRSYSGKIIGVLENGSDKTAIQMLSGNRAVLHTIKDAAAKSTLNAGEDLTLAVDENWQSAVQERSAEKAKKAELTREGVRR